MTTALISTGVQFPDGTIQTTKAVAGISYPTSPSGKRFVSICSYSTGATLQPSMIMALASDGTTYYTNGENSTWNANNFNPPSSKTWVSICSYSPGTGYPIMIMALASDGTTYSTTGAGSLWDPNNFNLP